ncbi:uncharacterized protein LOC136073733 isoform X2 [Hydra vulgaris]|uniref:uncharacterized protein LOC136073733 isoform X2 n=1 Tax=Hydra vulgaris TaxID=6087 RepID=UPI0032EA4D6F
MHCIALRSEASGSCMYSSASLFFVSGNTLMDKFLHVKIVCWSEASGSCMYSSASLFFVSGNTLMDVLRVLTSLEIYIHADYYCLTKSKTREKSSNV